MLLAFVFDSVGAGEWLVLLAVLLVVIGPKNLPSTLRKFGNYYGKFRRAADSFKRQLMDMDREFERAAQEAENEAKSAVDFPEGTQPDTSVPPEAAMYARPDAYAYDDGMPREEPVAETPVNGAPAEGVASAAEGEKKEDGDQPHQES